VLCPADQPLRTTAGCYVHVASAAVEHKTARSAFDCVIWLSREVCFSRARDYYAQRRTSRAAMTVAGGVVERIFGNAAGRVGGEPNEMLRRKSLRRFARFFETIDLTRSRRRNVAAVKVGEDPVSVASLRIAVAATSPVWRRTRSTAFTITTSSGAA
jgi:hypothetical protein